MYAARHLVLAVGKVVLGLLGVALLAQLILRRVVGWIAERLPHADLPSIPWPQVELPSIPWPELPNFGLPGWLLAVLATAKYWVPILVAVGLTLREIRKRTSKRDPAASEPGKDPPRMRTVDPEKHQQRRLAIIEAAIELFAAKGFARTTTAEICRAVGTSTGNLFHYFPSKQAIFYGIFEVDRAEWDAAFDAAGADPDPWAALMTVVDRIAEEAAHPVVAGLMVEVLAQAHRDPDFAVLLAENDRRMMRGVADLVERLRGAGLAEPGLPLATAARWVLTLTDAFYGRGYPEADRDRAGEVATAKQLIARVLRYTGPAVPQPGPPP